MFKFFALGVFCTLMMGCSSHQNQSDANSSNHVGHSKSLHNSDNQRSYQKPIPDWLKTATIYQINTRQFTPQGTFRAAEEQLPRLKDLGIDVVWLMPIHPIGEENRKGNLGSPYSVKDFFDVNPELGTKDDLQSFIDQAHGLGMYVILDWVANHTAWDNVIKGSNPDWYIKDVNGQNMPTLWFDWTDIIDLDFSKPELQDYMISAMRYWVEEFNIDGYRCDAAGLVPSEFWARASRELNQLKPVFMLAEWEGPQFYEQGFDATYAWSWWDTMHKIAMGKAEATAFHAYYAWNDGYYPDRAMRLLYTSNHDVNSWEATQFEAFGDALKTAIALSVVSEGIPMIYNGQEAGNNKRLAFFERDPIEWKEHPIGEWYRSLFALKKSNSALWNGKWGGRMLPINNNNQTNVLSFTRETEQDKVVAIFNLSPDTQRVTLRDHATHVGEYGVFPTNTPMKLALDSEFELAPWEYRLLIR